MHIILTLIVCFSTMSDFMAKLNKLEVTEGPPRAAITDLTHANGYPIVKGRFHVHPQYGTSVILDILIDSKPFVVFLPKRFAMTLSQADVDRLSEGGFRIKCTGVTNKSPNVKIYQ